MAPIWKHLLNVGQALLSLSPAPTFDHLPSINITLTPNLVDNAYLAVSMVYESPNVLTNDALVDMLLMVGWLPTGAYGQNNITAEDENGELKLTIRDAANTRSWYGTRDTVGNVKLDFIAYPRTITPDTRPAPRVDLRTDQGGLIGSGQYFLPTAPNKTKLYDINMQWNLSNTPQGTTAVWSFGEGPISHRVGTVDDILSYYAVGPLLHSYSSSIQRPDDFGMYWFGEPFFDASDMGQKIGTMYGVMQEYFEEQEEFSFRVFVRKSTSPSFGGTGGPRSFLLEYSGNTVLVDEFELFYLIVHELVHEYPLMQIDDHSDHIEEYKAGWYIEGIANYYAAVLPYLSKSFNDDSEFLKAANNFAQAYYTSPAVNVSEKDALPLAGVDSHAQRIPYNRGAMYFFKIDYEIRVRSGGERSLRDLVLTMLEWKRAKKSYKFEDFAELLQTELGSEAVSDLYDMLEGKLVIPSERCLDYAGLRLIRQDQEVFEMGFESKHGKVTNLHPASRAAEAGLKEGDIILESCAMWRSADDITKNATYTVQRGHEVKTIEFWPRSFGKTESYQWVKA
jgi:hypothetical protein